MPEARKLDSEEQSLLDELAMLRLQLQELTTKIKNHAGVDARWHAIGVTALQQGCMAIERAITRPRDF